MIDEQEIATLKAQIAWNERDLAELLARADRDGFLSWEHLCERDGILACLELLHADLRLQLGESDPTKH